MPTRENPTVYVIFRMTSLGATVEKVCANASVRDTNLTLLQEENKGKGVLFTYGEYPLLGEYR